jgi:hypothetical protein
MSESSLFANLRTLLIGNTKFIPPATEPRLGSQLLFPIHFLGEEHMLHKRKPPMAVVTRFLATDAGFLVYLSVSILLLGVALTYLVWPSSSAPDSAIGGMYLADSSTILVDLNQEQGAL